MSGSGAVRNCKVIYIQKELFQKVNQILLCGMPKDMEYEKICKFNSYYALTSTDSEPVSMPNFVVVDDCKKDIEDNADMVENNGKDTFQVYNDQKVKVRVLPFDGGGLVSPQRAAKWAEELELDYVPAAFQMRAIPGFKGNLYVFDVNAFAAENEVSKITDIWGRSWDLFDDKIDCILTKSQFKFWKQFRSFEEWKRAFETELYGYKRTWNISEYSDPPEGLKHKAVTSYQMLQTLQLTDQEIEDLCSPTIDTIRAISMDIGEFLRFRGLTGGEDQQDAIR